MNIFPSGSDPLDRFGTTLNFSSDLHQIADLLTVGQVAVYPVDIRGLSTDPVRDVIGDRLGSLEIPLPLTPEKANATHP